MAYTEISTSLITSGKSLLYTLFQLMKDNFDNHDSRVAAMESALVALPAGAIIRRGSDIVPTGYLAADGSAVSRSTYAALFSVVGTLYGPGDGLTTFNVPDLRGRTSYGAATAADVAIQRGEETHELTVAEMPVHTHNTTDPTHTHTFTTSQDGNRTVADPGDVNDFQNTASVSPPLSFGATADVDYASTGITIATSGDGDPHNNMHPCFVCAYMVKT